MIQKSEKQRQREAERESKRPPAREKSPVLVRDGDLVATVKPNALAFRRKRVVAGTLDPPRLLRATPHGTDYDAVRRSYDDEGVPKDLHDPSTIAAAAEESGYTSSQTAALNGEPEAVPLEEQERQTRLTREKRERIVLSPLIEIDKRIERLEDSGNYKNADLKFVRKKLGEIGRQALGTAATG